MLLKQAIQTIIRMEFLLTNESNFDGNGKVTSGIDGYTQPFDIDTNNFYDFTEIGPNQASSETATACVSIFGMELTITLQNLYVPVQ